MPDAVWVSLINAVIVCLTALGLWFKGRAAANEIKAEAAQATAQARKAKLLTMEGNDALATVQTVVNGQREAMMAKIDVQAAEISALKQRLVVFHNAQAAPVPESGAKA